MVISLIFTVSATAALLVINALRRPVPPGRGFPPLWLPGMVVSELAPWWMVGLGLIAGALFAGWDGSGLGVAAATCIGFSSVGGAALIRRSWRSAKDAGTRPSPAEVWQVRARLPEGVTISPEISYWEGLTMNVIRRSDTAAAPALVYLHPGSWMRGGPGRQARALLFDLAGRGWVVLDVRYPLSPAATFPDHLIGVKRAIAWAKGEGAALGIEPDLVAVAGGSSGAHLAALVALTSGDSALQPGFEATDTSVIACAPHYGIYDLLVRNRTRHDWPFVARHVMKTTKAESPDLYRLGSPIDLGHRHAPPFLVVHGDYDSVVLPAESEHFVTALRDAGADARYHPVVGGQHGFDAFAALRGRAVGSMVADFLDGVAREVRERSRLRDR